MSDVIDLLESIGQDARLFAGAKTSPPQVLDRSPASHVIRAAIASGDTRPLQAFACAARITFCGVFPADDGDEAPDEAPDDSDEVRRGVMIVR